MLSAFAGHSIYLQLSRRNINSVACSYLGVGVGTSLIWAVHQTLPSGKLRKTNPIPCPNPFPIGMAFFFLQGRGERAYDIFSRLLKERIICLMGPVSNHVSLNQTLTLMKSSLVPSLFFVRLDATLPCNQTLTAVWLLWVISILSQCGLGMSFNMEGLCGEHYTCV